MLKIPTFKLITILSVYIYVYIYMYISHMYICIYIYIYFCIYIYPIYNIYPIIDNQAILLKYNPISWHKINQPGRATNWIPGLPRPAASPAAPRVEGGCSPRSRASQASQESHAQVGLVGSVGYPLVNVYITNWKITIEKMGKSTISMAIFNSKLLNYQRVVLIEWKLHWLMLFQSANTP